jgi:K+-transporting ATPase ATPase C chain
MIREARVALLASVVTFVLCSILYPGMTWALAHLAFPRQSEGSLIHDRQGVVIGSEIVAQPFKSDKYFWPRPSAVDYNASAAGGSNLGPHHPGLAAKVVERAKGLGATSENPAPIELVTASGSGLDPHISLEGALYQSPRVATARNMPIGELRALIDRFAETSGAVLGASTRVNVLKLNRALDQERPAG